MTLTLCALIISPSHSKKSFIAPSCVALQSMAKLPVQAVRNKELLNQITSADIDHKEIEDYAEVYSLKELADIFIAQNNFESLPNPTYE